MSFGYVGKDLAKMLGKSIPQAVEGQLRAALVDFGEVSKAAGVLRSELSDGAEITVESGNATLRLNLKGELDVQDGLVDDQDVSDGNNMAYVPPGFVSKETDPDSVEGRLKMSPTLTPMGVVSNAEFEFKGGRLVGWKSSDKAKMAKLLDPIPEAKRRFSLMGIGLNPAMKYGLGQDRFVGGAVTLAGLGFSAVVRNATVSASGGALVRDGKLSP